jgi:hypothetical protein
VFEVAKTSITFKTAIINNFKLNLILNNENTIFKIAFSENQVKTMAIK